MLHDLYSSLRWRKSRQRALERDGRRCTVSRILGGPCRGRLHVHHVVPVADGGEPFDLDNLGTACAGHHRRWESLRRRLVEERRGGAPVPVRCPHRHATAEGRRICENRLRRSRERQLQLG